jgi:uncharacterized phage protein gp47/JayE
MSLSTPTTADLSTALLAQLESTLGQAIPLLPKSFLHVLANTVAGFTIILYKYSGFIFLQIFVKTATIAEVNVGGRLISPLTEYGRLIGEGDPKPAVQAQYDVDIVVENQVGQLESGTQLLGENNGVTYTLVGAVALDAPTVNGVVRAAFDQSGGNGSGVIGNLQVGNVINFANPLANVARAATITAQTIEGADQEDSEVYRARVLERFKKRPQGGALVDYEHWGEGVTGVQTIYPYTGAVAGEVDIYVESSVDTDGIPSAGLLLQVLDAVILDDGGLASRRPANAYPNVYAITRTGFDVKVTGLTVDDPATAQADIQAAVLEFFLESEPYVSGVTLPPRRDHLTQSALIGLVYDVVSAANGTFTNVQFEESPGGGYVASYDLGQGEKAKLENPVTFV